MSHGNAFHPLYGWQATPALLLRTISTGRWPDAVVAGCTVKLIL